MTSPSDEATAMSRFHHRAMIGSSTGSIDLLRYLVGGAEEAARFWTTLAWRPLLREGANHHIFRDGILNPERFRARVEDGVDFARLKAGPRSIGFLVVNLETGRVLPRGEWAAGSALRATVRCAEIFFRRASNVGFADAELVDFGRDCAE